jgi:hypothetical protein
VLVVDAGVAGRAANVVDPATLTAIEALPSPGGTT